jgi:hypothetical protein
MGCEISEFYILKIVVKASTSGEAIGGIERAISEAVNIPHALHFEFRGNQVSVGIESSVGLRRGGAGINIFRRGEVVFAGLAYHLAGIDNDIGALFRWGWFRAWLRGG